jgi:signal transduction histidine kinase
MKVLYLCMFLIVCVLINNNSYCQRIQKDIDSINSISSEFISSNLDSSLIIFTKNLKKAESLAYKTAIAKTLDKLSFIYYLKGNLGKSTEYLQRAVKLYEALNKLDELSILYGEYGYRLKRYDLVKAKFYMNKGIRIAENIKYLPGLAMLYDNYGVLKETENDLDSALYYYKRALRNKFILKDTIGIPYSYNNLAGAYALKKDYQKALCYLDSSDVYRAKEKGESGKADNLVIRGEILSNQGNIDKAIPVFKKCVDISKELKNINLTQYCCERISSLYELKNDFKNALHYFKIHSAYKDTIVNVSTNKRIAELQTAYETEKKDQLLASNALEIQKKNNLLLILASITVFTFLIAGWILRVQMLKRERVKSELTLLNQLDKVKFDNKLRSEMLRISRDLHDNIGSQLTFIISTLDNLIYKNGDNKLNDKLNLLRKFGKDTLTDLRNTVWAIKQEEVDFQQLILKINDLIQRIQSECNSIKIVLNNNTNELCKPSSSQMLNIYRIIQEALQNILKHANSTEVFIEFENTDLGFSMSISDNGQGIDINNLSSGNGLKNMKERCNEAEGTFSINGNASGTRIDCSFPIK